MTAQTNQAGVDLICTQCGAALHHDEGQLFITCSYCSSTVYLDKSQVVFHWYLAPTLDEKKARGILSRWMSGDKTVKDLDKKSRPEEITFSYFPLWYIKRRDPNGTETVDTEPAAATSISEIRHLEIPAGDLRKYQHDLDSDAVPPTIPLEAAFKWFNISGDVSEAALVHLPIYTCKYQYKRSSYIAIIEASTGQVLANLYPEKAEVPFHIIADLTAIIFLLLSFIPIFSSMAGGSEGLLSGYLFFLGLMLSSGFILWLVSVYIASKV